GRFAARYDNHGGYFPNPLAGHPNGAVKDETYARGSLKWTPNNLPITWNLIGDYADYHDSGNGVAVAAINPAGPLAGFYGISQGVQSGAIPPGTPIPLAPGVFVPASAFAGFAPVPFGPIQQFLNPEFASSAQGTTL